MKGIRLFLDTNIFIFALGKSPDHSSTPLLKAIAENSSLVDVRIPRTICNEIRRNLPPSIFREFLLYMDAVGTIDEDALVPSATVEKYRPSGLKPADAFIAGFCEFIRCDFLVSKNRHFLARQSCLPFRVIPPSECLRILSHPA